MDKQQRQKLLTMQIGRKQNIYIGRTRSSLDKNMIKRLFFYNLREIMSQWNYKDISEAITYILKINSKNFEIFKNALFPEKYEFLNQGMLIDVREGDLEKELCLYSILFSCSSNKINCYLKLKEKYENLLIKGEYVNAKNILDEIESNIGVSIWGLDNRFILNEYTGGLESNKDYLANINSINCDSWVSLLADFFSFKAEKGVNNRQYVHRIEKILDKAPKDLKPFFIEKLFPLYEIDFKDIYNMLYYNSGLSIIDLYNTYIKACIRIISGDDADYKSKKAVSKSLTLIGNVEDIVVDKIKLIDINSSENIKFSPFDVEMLSLGDLYTKGEYEEVISITENLLNKKANCFELYEYYVKSHVMIGKEIVYDSSSNIKNEIISALYIAYVKDKTFPKSYLSISKFARLFSNSYLGTEFANFFADKYMIGLSNILSRGKEFFSPFYNLKLINALPDKRNAIMQIFEKTFNGNDIISLYKYVYLNNDELNRDTIDKNRLRWYKIKKDILNEKSNAYQELYEWYNELVEENGIYQTYQKERISTELYYMYIENNMFLEAEELMVNATINNKYSTLRMDLDCLFAVSKQRTEEIKKNICTPIATYLYNKNDYAAIYSVTANFLDYNRVDKPSDLFEIDERYDKKQLIYFLRYVCVSEILDSMYNVFEVDEDVESERIEICKYLQSNDADNANIYIEEISQIMQKQKILQGVKYLEDVKIDIDLNKVVEVHHDVFGDNYKRFQHIGELEIEYATYDVTSNMIYVKNNEDSKKYSHKLIVFKEMLFDYRQELAFEKYGLDQTLGTRIRHGSLQNQIRIAFEKNNIAFVRKNTEEGKYLPSREFDNYCIDMDSEAKEKLLSYISEFSKDVDNYIDILNTEYIRIKTEDKNIKGLFEFSIKINELMYLFQEVQELQNENLVLELFENYWLEKIELGLENARKFFKNQVKQQFISMLNKLEENLNTIESIDKMQYNLFDSISRSRTEIQKSIDVIVDWFKLPRKQEYNNYDAQSLVETCEMINKRVFTNYESIQLEKNVMVESKFLGRTFSYIIDIMVILFTNAYYHSGYIDNISKLELTLNIIEDNEYITIVMKNNLSDGVNKNKLVEIIQDVQVKLDECIKKREYYNYEGKSGYIKICKILDYNLSCRSYLEFGMDKNEKHYITTIQVPKHSIIEMR